MFTPFPLSQSGNLWPYTCHCFGQKESLPLVSQALYFPVVFSWLIKHHLFYNFHVFLNFFCFQSIPAQFFYSTSIEWYMFVNIHILHQVEPQEERKIKSHMKSAILNQSLIKRFLGERLLRLSTGVKSDQEYQSMVLCFHFSLLRIGEGNGNPLQCSCLENPRDGGAWWAAVYGVAQSRTRLKRLSSSSSCAFIQQFCSFFNLLCFLSILSLKNHSDFHSFILLFHICYYKFPSFFFEIVKLLSHVQLFATLQTVAHQAPLSMGFSRQEYWSGLPFPSLILLYFLVINCIVFSK